MPLVYERKANYSMRLATNKRISVPTYDSQRRLRSFFPQYMFGRLVLNLLKSRETIAMLYWFITFCRICSLAFTNILKCENSKCPM